jgi:hypothetical protein
MMLWDGSTRVGRGRLQRRQASETADDDDLRVVLTLVDDHRELDEVTRGQNREFMRP